jgi:hypothetical protein
MKVQSIISNTISEEALQKGHLSIRFMADGFSLLLEDGLYNPLVLIKHIADPGISLNSHILSCKDWMDRQTLLDGFIGEVTIVLDLIPCTIVPENLFSEKDAALYLESIAALKSSDFLKYKAVKNRPFIIVYSIPSQVMNLSDLFSGNVRIVSTNDVMLSVVDHIDADKHQRGFTLIDLHERFLGILSIRKDEVEILNQLDINNKEEAIYYTLNSLEKINFDRTKDPLYFTGVDGEEIKSLRKYIKNVIPLPYFIPKIKKSLVLEHVVLAEASKCE